MKTYRIAFANRMICPNVFTLRALSLESAIATSIERRARYAPGDTVADAREITEPAFLSRWRDSLNVPEKKNPEVSAAFKRASFATGYMFLTDVLKYVPRHCSARATFGDIDNAISESVDHSSYYFDDRNGPDDGDIDDACDLVLHLCPNMPRCVLDRETVASDLRAAMCNASEQDRSAQFTEWLADSIGDAADGLGVAWSWHDGENAQAYPWDADRIMFAISRRDYLKGGRWEARQDWETQREYMERADDVLSDLIEEMRGAVDTSDFDEHGCDGDWPEYFLDGRSDAIEEFESADEAMRARLVQMIRNRAPLADRAALVATVYGVAG